MLNKYSSGWKWFLTIYLIYLAIDLFLKAVTGFPQNILWILIFGGNLFSIFSVYSFINNKIHIRKLLRILIFGIFILFVVFNTIVFSVVIISYFWNYLSDISQLTLDLIGLIFPIITLYPVTELLLHYQFKKNKIRSYVLKGYLWFIFIFLAVVFPFTIMEIGKWTFYDYLVNISLVLFLLGLFSYLLKKTFLNKKIWKWYFWISIVWSVFDILYHLAPEGYFSLPNFLKSYNTETLDLNIYLVLLFIFLPAYYPLYKIAFDKNFFKN